MQVLIMRINIIILYILNIIYSSFQCYLVVSPKAGAIIIYVNFRHDNFYINLKIQFKNFQTHL